MTRILTALPVFNESKTLNWVLDKVVQQARDILVVNDGSTDATPQLLARRRDVEIVHHELNRGYGAALMTAFDYAIEHDFDVLVTMDCDGQHEPKLIQPFAERLMESGADIVSGSRYLAESNQQGLVPVERRRINFQITQFLNARLKLSLTDSFCGFKAYRVTALRRLHLTEPGYAMPLELWVQAACQHLKVIEMAVPLIYLDEKRSFGGTLDNGDTRLKYYLDVIEKSMAATPCGNKF